MLPTPELESKLGYRFQNRQHLLRALTHRSCVSEVAGPEQNGHNEQLEFLGDSILGFVASEVLFARSPEAREGVLSRLKSHLVSSAHLYQCAVQLELGSHMVLGKGEERNGGRDRKALLADALEAVIAAIYIDGGMEPVKAFICTHILRPLESAEDVASIELLNHKSILQERALATGLPAPRYVTVGSDGPEHAKVFTVEGRIGDKYSAQASGSSKKAASQGAAEALLEQLEKTNPLQGFVSQNSVST